MACGGCGACPVDSAIVDKPYERDCGGDSRAKDKRVIAGRRCNEQRVVDDRWVRSRDIACDRGECEGLVDWVGRSGADQKEEVEEAEQNGGYGLGDHLLFVPFLSSFFFFFSWW